MSYGSNVGGCNVGGSFIAKWLFSNGGVTDGRGNSGGVGNGGDGFECFPTMS